MTHKVYRSVAAWAAVKNDTFTLIISGSMVPGIGSGKRWFLKDILAINHVAAHH
jgi:hypothetical protein